MNNPLVKKMLIATEKPYEVVFGKNIIADTGKLIKEILNPNKIALITDDVVDKLYSASVVESLTDAGFSVVKFVFPNGEKNKNLSTYGEILSFLAQNELTRTDLVVALGGGVVGDMAGFAAATYLRGIDYVQIPTTLLSQIDSSVGGKTAVDLNEGKNLVGAFHQPKLVICDVASLSSLSEKILTDGLGEGVKYAILDEKIFDILSSDYDVLDFVYACVDYKRKIVVKDERESGDRKLLNLGHTLAHGIEKLSNYFISHGNAVSMGLKIILKNSFKHGYIKSDEYQKMDRLIDKIVGKQACPYNVEELVNASLNDKKRSGDKLSLIMIFGVGNCKIVDVKVSELWGYLD